MYYITNNLAIAVLENIYCVNKVRNKFVFVNMK